MPAYPPTTKQSEQPRGTVAVPPALRLPVIENAFPRHLHAYWPRLQENSRTWLLERRLMPPAKVARFADSLCYTDLVAGYYLGASDQVIGDIADFSTWFFVWDDRHDRDAVHGRDGAWQRLRGQLHAALDEPHGHLHHADPLVAAFAECVIRLFGTLGEDWNARFARHFHAVIEAYDREFANRRGGSVPTVEEYVELRRHTFGHHVWVDLLELAAACELPENVRRHPAYRRAALASQDFSAWYNDLCSLPKEIAGDEVHNLGISLIQHEGLSLEQAVTEVRRRVRICIAEFLAAEEEVLQYSRELSGQKSPRAREVSTGLQSCLFNLRNWFSSVYWFHHESGRYRMELWEDSSTPPYLSDPLEPAGEE
ncbi:multidrug MFS transporter [Streptomyces sp. NA04227]|uniref:terpene synthase family protein n=1 Tax=Streptomyces sp. NA04227 TaxID=2742136 RepID=UPI00159290DC|nr:multidrug MFS transporter [Streptomyces sp. NA04227]QKW09159.1 multidrug MFS transporter [Streptomyces sp. NA04227]